MKEYPSEIVWEDNNGDVILLKEYHFNITVKQFNRRIIKADRNDRAYTYNIKFFMFEVFQKWCFPTGGIFKWR
jgi:hypothetical protein